MTDKGERGEVKTSLSSSSLSRASRDTVEEGAEVSMTSGSRTTTAPVPASRLQRVLAFAALPFC